MQNTHALRHRCLMAFASLFLFGLPAVAQDSAPDVREATIDLNGDGTPEKVTITTKPESAVFTLTVGNTHFTENSKQLFDVVTGFQIVKLNGAGKIREISVTAHGDNDWVMTAFYRYDGNRISRMGIVEGVTSTPGNGAIYASQRMAFWQCAQKYVVSPKTGMLVFVPQADYYVGASAMVKTTFPIHQSPSGLAPVVADVAPNSKVQLLLFHPKKLPASTMSYEKGWYLIRTQTGLCGWADFAAFNERVQGLPFAG